MIVKKEVYERVCAILENELLSINYKIKQNLSTFKRLADEQTVLKRERVFLSKQINELKVANNIKKDKGNGT